MNANMTFREWIVRAEISSDTDKIQLEKLSRPMFVGGIKTPANLDSVTIGQLVELSECKDGRDMFYTTCRVLLNMSKIEIDKTPATQVVRFCGWVISKIKTINALFDSVKSKPTPEEERAGIYNLNFGMFGLIDWFAQRMKITDHEEVTKVPWMRVYKCLEIDNKRDEYKRRLAKVYEDQHRK